MLDLHGISRAAFDLAIAEELTSQANGLPRCRTRSITWDHGHEARAAHPDRAAAIRGELCDALTADVGVLLCLAIVWAISELRKV